MPEQEKTKPGWFHFTSDYDHRWQDSLAVTAFKEGMKVHVKGEVIDAATAAKAGKAIPKPKDDDPGRVTTQSRVESRIFRNAGNPVKTNGVAEPASRKSGTVFRNMPEDAVADVVEAVPPDGGSVTGDGANLSEASGGEGDGNAVIDTDRTAGQGLSGEAAADPAKNTGTANLEGAADKQK